MSPTSIEQALDSAPFGLRKEEKRAFLLEAFRELTAHHYENCPPYRNILDRLYGGKRSLQFESLEQIPFLPVSLFKTSELKSIPQEKIFKVLKSSGTTGQQPSRIFLDKETAQRQSVALVRIVQHFLGKQRRPMVVIDHAEVVSDRSSFSARGAGILGMSQFGRTPFFALNRDMSLNLEGLLRYLDRWKHEGILFFGFTYMVWQYFVRALEEHGTSLALKDSVLVHSGGWKKLQDQAVSAKELRRRIEDRTQISTVLNFYGMVEQVGSVFFENPLHYLHAPIFSDVIVRDPITWEVLPRGETGLVQVLSVLPRSYPGHSLLTEDLGAIRGEDDDRTKMKGKFFEVFGRLPKSELRGCSDTLATAQSESP